MYKLSIIIPVYQVQPFLKRCLTSILEQTYKDYEVILIDDGSSDGSERICDEYANQYEFVKVIHKRNGGLASARNAGIAAASGKYLIFIDSDDVIHSRMLELELTTLEGNNADAIICPLKRFSNENEIDIHSAIENINDVSILTGIDAEKGFFGNSDVNKYVSSCGKIYKRELFNDINFPEGRLFEDEFVTYRIYYKCQRIVVIGTALYYYFINPAGITQNLSVDKRFDEYDAQIERISFFSERMEKELYHLALLEFLRTAQWDLINCQKGNQGFDTKRAEKLQKQYTDTLIQAEHEKIVTFFSNYEYYIFAFPKKRTIYRVKRLVNRFIGKM